MTIKSILSWFQAAVPEPTDKSRAVQIGCHYEEVAEMCDVLGEDDIASEIVSTSRYYKNANANHFYIENLVASERAALLDSLCDQIVTAIGVAHMFGMDIEGALAEVDRSNWSKAEGGKFQFDANGKIQKPASYSPPVLDAFVGEKV